jgi:hypothetical protein
VLGDGLEATGTNIPEMVTFCKGHGTDGITLIITAMQEAAIEFAKALRATGKGEKKFFDRVVLELQMLAPMQQECPSQEHVEFKTNDTVHETTGDRCHRLVAIDRWIRLINPRSLLNPNPQ